jgi:hypothetical protein
MRVVACQLRAPTENKAAYNACGAAIKSEIAASSEICNSEYTSPFLLTWMAHILKCFIQLIDTQIQLAFHNCEVGLGSSAYVNKPALINETAYRVLRSVKVQIYYWDKIRLKITVVLGTSRKGGEAVS